MKLQLIRNATMKIDYAGRSLLTDPLLCPRGTLFTITGAARNPTARLPLPPSAVVAGVECIIVSHGHPDHFDRTASRRMIPRAVPLFCPPNEAAKRSGEGFRHVVPVVSSCVWRGITITRREGRHGHGRVRALTGAVSGYVFEAPGEPTVYWTGDSVWCPEVEETIAAFRPDVVVTHSGGGAVPGLGRTIMDERQTLRALGASRKSAVVVAVHMEAMDHCTVTRHALRRAADGAGVPQSRLLIPADGEVLAFPQQARAEGHAAP